LAFATRAVDAPHRIETPARLLFRGIPVRAVRGVAADPKVDLDGPGLLSWGSSIAPSPTRLSLRPHPPGPSSRLRSGTATSRTCSVPAVPPGFNGFLRRGRIRRLAPSTACGFVAPRSRPWGSPRFGLPGPASRPNPTRRSWTRRSGGVFPCGEYPSKRSPPRQPWTMPSPRVVLSDSVAFTGWRALPPFRAVLAAVSPRCAALLADLRAFFRRGVRCGRATLPLRARSMLPWALDRLVPDAATRFASPSLVLDVSPCGPTASASPTRMSREGKMSRPCLAPCDRRCGLPRREDRVRSRWLRHLPKEAPRPHPYWAPKESVGCRWIRPEEVPPRRSGARRRAVANVIATHLRRDSCATQHSLRRAAPVVRAPSPHPSAVARVLDGKTARRGRSHPEVCAPARHSRTSRRMLRRNPAAGIPKDSDRWASRGPPGGGPLATRGSG
jgi:hypothetical protein